MSTHKHCDLTENERRTRERIGKVITEGRERQGWTQAHMAAQIGRTQAWLSRVESGDRWFSSASEMVSVFAMCGMPLPWDERDSMSASEPVCIRPEGHRGGCVWSWTDAEEGEAITVADALRELGLTVDRAERDAQLLDGRDFGQARFDEARRLLGLLCERDACPCRSLAAHSLSRTEREEG